MPKIFFKIHKRSSSSSSSSSCKGGGTFSLFFFGSFFCFFLVDLHDEADEEIEAEGSPGVFVEVVVGEGGVILRAVTRSSGQSFRPEFLRDEGHIERATCFTDAAFLLEIGEAPYAGAEFGAEILEIPRVFERTAVVDGLTFEDDGILPLEIIGGEHEPTQFVYIIHTDQIFGRRIVSGKINKAFDGGIKSRRNGRRLLMPDSIRQN